MDLTFEVWANSEKARRFMYIVLCNSVEKFVSPTLSNLCLMVST